jgi:hypothetical protein
MEKTQTASFQNMISNLAVNQQNKEGQEVSVSYYFICLLHLANEKVIHNFIKFFKNFFYYILFFNLGVKNYGPNQFFRS